MFFAMKFSLNSWKVIFCIFVDLNNNKKNAYYNISFYKKARKNIFSFILLWFKKIKTRYQLFIYDYYT